MKKMINKLNDNIQSITQIIIVAMFLLSWRPLIKGLSLANYRNASWKDNEGKNEFV